MRRISCALVGVVGCLIAGRAEADVSKAWAAAKDNLPQDTQFIATIDVAAIYKSSLYAKALDAFKSMDRDFPKVYDGIKSACGWDPMSVIDGVVIAGDPFGKKGAGIAFVQLTIDRTKASACLESAINAILTKKGDTFKIKVSQDGNYTVAKGKGKNDSAYFPWVGPNVVAISLKPDEKDVVDAWFGKKTFSKSTVAGLISKIDPKAVVGGAFATNGGKPIDAWVPVTQGYGNWMAAGGKLSGSMVVTGSDVATAKKLADELNQEMQKDLKKDRTPASIKKIMNAISITASGADITIKGSASEKELGEALGEAFMKKKDKDVEVSDADVQKLVTQMDNFSTKMCACKNKACADKVNEEMTKWGTDLAKDPKLKQSKPSPDLAKRSADIMMRYTECMTKVMMAGQPKNP